jgi:hypothetical protein
MEEVLAVTFLFGGGALVLIAYSPIGKALAARIRGETPGQSPSATDPAVLDEIEHLREELGQVQERLDFTERMLAGRRESAALKTPEA